MERKIIKFNEEIALRVFSVLNEAWQEKSGIFKDAVLPQDRWPPKEELSSLSEKDLADWLFYCALPMRGGLVSEDPFKIFWKLRKKYPEMFRPEIVAEKWTTEMIKKAFNEIGMNYKDKEHSESWCKNSKNLFRYWENDIRNVFWGVTRFEEAFKRIDYERNEKGFYGMRRKIFSLLTIWLQEKGLIQIFASPLPVDFHALRILWATEIIDLKNWARPFLSKERHPQQLAGKTAIRVWYSLTDQITIWSEKFLNQHKISHLTINPALWVLSRSLCAGHFQNTVREDATKYVETERLIKNPNLWPKKYKNPCAYCFIEEWCKWAIPSAPYYRWGILIRLGKRIPYPITKFLPGFEPPPKIRKKNRGAD